MANNNKKKRGVMTVEEAGRKGGLATARAHGPEFYSKIGKKGGEHSHRRGRKSNQ
jgi:hypothetical protein